MKWIVVTAVLSLVSGCAVNLPAPETRVAEVEEVVAVRKEFIPEVWSGHKILPISEEVCAEKGMAILSSLGFIQIVKSKHGEYVYGNFSNNRAAIKCVSVEKQTFVYAIVAGPKAQLVEKLRNEIMWQY